MGAAGWGTARAVADAPDQSSVSTVLRVRAEGVVIGRKVHRRLLAEMLEKGLTVVTGQSSSAEAWRTILRPDDIVGLKFNRSGANVLGTTVAMAETLVDSLTAAGFEPSRLVPIEVPEAIHRERGTTRPDSGWQPQETAFGSGTDRLAAVLDQVTAVINVPFLKTHNIAGVTCCLKNLSHALVKHPARYHASHCSPYIADIVALPQIRNKLRLHLVNALRVVFDGGPEATEEWTHDAGALYFATDPVAMDSVAVEEINHLRLERNLAAIDREGPQLDYLRAASARNLGRSTIHDIALQKLGL